MAAERPRSTGKDVSGGKLEKDHCPEQITVSYKELEAIQRSL
jgi:hypothetical protein